MFRKPSRRIQKLSVRSDLFIPLNPNTIGEKETKAVETSTKWHVPQDGKKGHVRRLFTETIPFGRSSQARDSKSELGYEGDDDISNSSDDDNREVPYKRRKIYYEGKIGGPAITSPSYKYYTPASPAYSPVRGQTHWTDNLEVSTLIFNPFKSDGDTTDDENSNNNDRTDAELDAYYLSLFSE